MTKTFEENLGPMGPGTGVDMIVEEQIEMYFNEADYPELEAHMAHMADMAGTVEVKEALERWKAEAVSARVGPQIGDEVVCPNIPVNMRGCPLYYIGDTAAGQLIVANGIGNWFAITGSDRRKVSVINAESYLMAAHCRLQYEKPDRFAYHPRLLPLVTSSSSPSP